MGDSYPAQFEIEIDREPLKRHLRRRLRAMWCIWMLMLGALVGAVVTRATFLHTNKLVSMSDVWAAGATILLAVGAFQVLAMIGYLKTRKAIDKRVDRLLLAVEGPFLRIRMGLGGVERDRRIHFRLILSYATKQDESMKNYGISTLVMTTSVGLETTRDIEVPAVKDCLQVRDMLSVIDSHREDTLARPTA
jgi:hypothetical protein